MRARLITFSTTGRIRRIVRRPDGLLLPQVAGRYARRRSLCKHVSGPSRNENIRSIANDGHWRG